MSEAADKLARTRLAIVQHLHDRERRHVRKDRPAPAHETGFELPPDEDDYEPLPPGSNWFQKATHAVRTWWRYHPAQMAVQIASPILQSYARRRPAQMIGISLALGAVVMFVRPWKLVSITGILFAILKSSQVSSLLLSALSAADFEKDSKRPEWK